MQKIANDKMDALVLAAAELRQLFVEYDRLKEEAEMAMLALVDQMNEKRAAMREVLAEAHGDADEYFSDRSEKWQQSDRGSAYQDWVAKLDQLSDEADEEFELPSWDSLAQGDWIGEIEDGSFGEPEY